MCDFKPGDEVVCVDAKPRDNRSRLFVKEGETYTVRPCGRRGCNGVLVNEAPAPIMAGMISACYHPRRFRKVQKRNDRLTIEAFSVIKDGGFEEPKRTAPAKKRERAS